MAIIISKNGKNALKVERTKIEEEAYLQRYIHENPDTLPLEELKENLRLLILAKEFPTESGPIDVLGVDSDGDIYVVETKLYKNPDKRLVVAQMLDYGAALWHGYQDFGTFTAQIESITGRKLKGGLASTLSEFFGLGGEDTNSLLQSIKQNLFQGRFQFVVLMNQLESRLRTLISFINSNSNFRVLGCELQFYHYDQFEILIPNLYGAEAGSTGARASGSSSRKKWTREMYNDELKTTEPTDRRIRIGEVIALAQSHEGLFHYPSVGSGTTGSLSFYDASHERIVTAYLNGKLEIVIDPSKPNFPSIRELMKKKETKPIWSGSLDEKNNNYLTLASKLEELTPQVFSDLKQFLFEFATLRAK